MQNQVARFHRQAGDIPEGFRGLIAAALIYHICRAGACAAHGGDGRSGDGDGTADSVFVRVRNGHFAALFANRNPLLSAAGVYGSQGGAAGAVFNVDGNISGKCVFGSVVVRSVMVAIKAAHGQAAREDVGCTQAVGSSALKIRIPQDIDGVGVAGRRDRNISFVACRQQRAAENIGRETCGGHTVQSQRVSVCYNRVAAIGACKVQLYISKRYVRAQQNAGCPNIDAVILAVDSDVFVDDPRGLIVLSG